MQTVDRLPFTLKHHVRHSAAVLKAATRIGHEYGDAAGETLGGVLRNGQLSYLAVGSLLEVVTAKTGVRVASCNFDSLFLTQTHITCVTELPLPRINTCVLAIGLDSAQHGGLVCLFAVHGAQLLRTVELVDKVTACSLVAGDRTQCERLGDLRLFDGCLAVGTHGGRVLLLDLRHDQCEDVLFGRRPSAGATINDCLIVLASSVPLAEIRTQQRRARSENIDFGVQLDGLPDAGAVLCTLVLRPLQALAVGLSDGRLVLHTLRAGSAFAAFHLAHPSAAESPLLRLAMIEPADDPRACCYLWAFHVHAEQSAAVMHSIMYERKRRVPGDDDCGGGRALYEFEDFQSCTVRLTMPLYDRESYPIVCQAIGRTMSGAGRDDATDDDDDEEADTLSLCLLAWTNGKGRAGGSTVCVFDLNQWYKEQMPAVCDWRRAGNTFVALFPLGDLSVLDVWLDPGTLTPFASQQRPEEHFWPEALHFECIALTATESCRLRWPGLQNQSLEMLVQCGPPALLEPNQCFAAMLRATLIPQFSDYHPNVTQTQSSKQQFLLSVALEYNCTALLRDCALAWADGSHVGGRNDGAGLSLSTLTDWMWSRATATKTSCNRLCVPLFDHSGCRLDGRTRQQLLNCTRQLRTLADLMGMVLERCSRYIPGEVRTRLQSQRDAMRMAYEYQEVLHWLLNMGLLPEGGCGSADAGESSGSDEAVSRLTRGGAVPYPYRALRQFYTAQRQKFRDIDAALLNSKRSCRVLYIDAFIEQQCNPACLRAEWRQTGPSDTSSTSGGLYPPPSLQAMLRTLLVPGVTAEIKHTLFVYLFLDLSLALADERFVGIVQRLIKFPAVFRLNPALIKTTQAFWNLDHGQLETAIEELISPLSQERQLLPWQQETLVESLLVQQAGHLALRALRAPGPPITPLLEMRTLLANNLVAEAFQLQRAKADARLLNELFRTCHAQQKWHFVLDLSLSTSEERCLGEFLRTCDSSLTENLHFLYLLQRGKYLEAVTFVDDLQHNRRTAAVSHAPITTTTSATTSSLARRKARPDLDTPANILAAYKLTMTPATQSLATMYHALRDNINAKLNAPPKPPTMVDDGGAHPQPLSSKLLQHKLDMLGGVYHRSLLSAEQTNPTYWLNRPQRLCSLGAGQVPFLRNPQYDLGALLQHGGGALPPAPISHAVEYVPSAKRTARMDEREENGGVAAGVERERAEGPRKRRRVDPTANDTADVLAAYRASAAEATAATPKAGSRPEGVSLLSTPVVIASSAKQSTVQTATPHSILKARPTAADPADEKSIRFAALPGDEEDEEEEEIEQAQGESVIDIGDATTDEDIGEIDRCQATTTIGSDVEMSIDAEDDLMCSAAAPTATSTVHSHIRSNCSALGVAAQLDSSVEEFRTPEDSHVGLSITVPDEPPSLCCDDEDDDEDEEDEDDDKDDNEGDNLEDSDCLSPPTQSKLVFSQQPSPLQRRINLGEGPKPRKRLHSSLRRDTVPAAVDVLPVRLSEQPPTRIARKSKDTFVEQPQQPQQQPSNDAVASSSSSPAVRRSLRSRSKTPDVEPRPSASTKPAAAASLLVKSGTPMGRKPLSRLVLEANAKKAIVVAQSPAIAIIDSSSSSSNSLPEPPHAAEAAAVAVAAAVDDVGDQSPRHSIDDSNLSNASVVDTSSSSSINSAYLTDDSQRFLDYWAAKHPPAQNASMSRRLSSGSLSETTGVSFSDVAVETDSDASFAQELTRREEDDDDVDGEEDDHDDDEAEDMDEDDMDDVDDVEDDDDDDEDEDDDSEDMDNNISSESSVASSETRDSPITGRRPIADPNEVINISSSSDEMEPTPTAVAKEAREVSTNLSSDDDDDRDMNGGAANVSDRVEVVADVHTEPSFEVAADDEAYESGQYQSANTSAQLYGDLEVIQRADDDSRDDVLNQANVQITVATNDEEPSTAVQDEDNTAATHHDELNEANLQTTTDVEPSTAMDEDVSAEPGNNELNRAALFETCHENADSESLAEVCDVSSTLNHAILCETMVVPMEQLESHADSVDEPMQTANNTLDDALVHVDSTQVEDVMDQGGYLAEETTGDDVAIVDIGEEVVVETAAEPMEEEKTELVSTPIAAAMPDDAESPAASQQPAVDDAPLTAAADTDAKLATIDDRIVSEPPATLTAAALPSTPIRASRRISTRARSVDADAATPADLMTGTPTRRLRETPTRSTAAATPLSAARKLRGQSEPKQLAPLAGETLRRAVSVRRLLAETIANVPEENDEAEQQKPDTPSTPQRRTAGRRSKQSTPAPEDAPTPTVAVGTPSRSLRSRRSSQNISPVTTSEDVATPLGTPSRRRTRHTSQSSPTAAEPTAVAGIVGTPKRPGGRSLRASSVISTSPSDADAAAADDDGSASVVSHGSRTSHRSTRSTRTKKKASVVVNDEDGEETVGAVADDDDDDDNVSVKSTRSTRSAARGSTRGRGQVKKALPAIDETKEAAEALQEDNDEETTEAEGTEVQSSTATYSESRRLTRHQITVMERMKSSAPANAVENPSARSRRANSVPSAAAAQRKSEHDDNDDDDDEVDDDNDTNADDDDRQSVQSTSRSTKSTRSRRAGSTSKTIVAAATAAKTLDSISEQDDSPAADAEKPKTRKTLRKPRK